MGHGAEEAHSGAIHLPYKYGYYIRQWGGPALKIGLGWAVVAFVGATYMMENTKWHRWKPVVDGFKKKEE